MFWQKILIVLGLVKNGQKVFFTYLGIAPPGEGILKIRKRISKNWDQAIVLRYSMLLYGENPGFQSHLKLFRANLTKPNQT